MKYLNGLLITKDSPDAFNYIMQVQQYMRKNPLEEILSLGLRVDKAEND